MDPLSITASITTVITAAAQISSLLSQIHHASTSITALAMEIDNIRIVFSALQRFIDRAKIISRQRAALIQVDDVIVILTRTLLVFSELQGLLAPFVTNDQRLSLKGRFNWTRQEPGINRLVIQLQQHKTSLNLLLQIIQCDSNLQAHVHADALQRQVETELEADADLATRFERVQLPSDTSKLCDLNNNSDGSHETALQGSANVTSTRLNIPQPQDVSEIDVPNAEPDFHSSLDLILQKTKVYDRVKDREVDAISAVSSNGSRSWSMLSGISMADISVFAVIRLPLDGPELIAIRKLLPKLSSLDYAQEGNPSDKAWMDMVSLWYLLKGKDRVKFERRYGLRLQPDVEHRLQICEESQEQLAT